MWDAESRCNNSHVGKLICAIKCSKKGSKLILDAAWDSDQMRNSFKIESRNVFSMG